MVGKFASGEDLSAILALNFEQVLTHVDAVGYLRCSVVLLIVHMNLVTIECAFISIIDRNVSTHILLAQRHHVIAT